MSRGVSVIGAGAWGRALAQAFSVNDEILLYSPTESKFNLKNSRIKISYEIESLKNSKYLFLVVPSTAVREVCRNLKPILDDACRIIICSKGIEQKTGFLMSEVIGEFFPEENIAVLSGPNFAAEILNGLPALTSIVAEDIFFAQELCKRFSTETFKLIPATNLINAQLFGTIKNVLAILCGVARGLKLGENFTAAIVTAGVQEIAQLAVYKNTSGKSLILEPAGIGDIFLTCSSTTSRNNKFGVDLVSKYIGKNYQEIFASEKVTVEGVSTILALKEWNIKLLLMDFAFEVISVGYKTKSEIMRRLQNIILKNHG